MMMTKAQDDDEKKRRLYTISESSACVTGLNFTQVNKSKL